MPQPITDGAQSPATLIDWHDRLGIPHFQRGLVWEPESVALLLESLYWQTPCGSIILWMPRDIDARGRGLGAAEVCPECLIVDGQQRIRSLYGACGGEAAAADEAASTEVTGQDDEIEPGREPEEEDGGDADRCWCVNLSRLDEFRGMYPGGERFRLFRNTRNPLLDGGTTARSQPGQSALVPLKWFLDNSDEQLRQFLKNGTISSVAPAVEAVLGSAEVRGRLRGMLTRPAFHVSILPPDRSLEHVVDMYNRINSGGKRVEPEEKAFANLAAAYRGANREVEAFFAAISGSHISIRQRDDLLERQRESRFGFKLFMRVFVIGLAYHRSFPLGSSSFSFKAADRELLTAASQDDLGTILEATQQVLAQVRELLTGGTLHCDDFRMLPDTASLWPVFQLLTRFPGIAVQARDRLSSVVLRLILASLPKKNLLELCERIGEARSVTEALAVIDQTEELTSDRMEETIRIGIGRAQSVTDRFALVLYWLLRRRHARDFSYKENLGHEPGRLAEMVSWSSSVQPKQAGEPLEARLEKGAEPQKQHIVPVSLLGEVYALPEGARPGRHKINAVGNLTYMSGPFNGYLVGVGQSPLKLRDERDSANLDAHMLGSLVDSFEQACHLGSGSKRSREPFETFCAKRAELITKILAQWEKELRDKGRSAEVVETVPAVRLLTDVSRLIRGFNYPRSVTDRLIRLFELPGIAQKTTPVKGAILSIPYERRTAKGRKQVLRLDVRPEQPDAVGLRPPREIQLTLRDEEWTAKFAVAFPDVRRIPMSHGVGRFRLGAESSAEQVTSVIDWIANQVSTQDLPSPARS